jgi:hypothetical protein
MLSGNLHQRDGWVCSHTKNVGQTVCWLLVRSRDTREILERWIVSSPKQAVRAAATVPKERYPLPITKDFICLVEREFPDSVL